MRLLCDSSALISLAETCLLWLVREFSITGTSFYITPEVREETVEKPLRISRFEFEAYKIKKLIDEGHIKVAQHRSMKKDKEKILRLSNNCFISEHGPIKIIHDGEAEVLALTRLMDNFLFIDEKTTRFLIEEPSSLRKRMEDKVEEKVRMDEEVLKELQELVSEVKIIRSSEMVTIAYEKGLLGRYGSGKKILNAALWAVRNNGCAITKDEINQLSLE